MRKRALIAIGCVPVFGKLALDVVWLAGAAHRVRQMAAATTFGEWGEQNQEMLNGAKALESITACIDEYAELDKALAA
jgi:hypothetical protein